MNATLFQKIQHSMKEINWKKIDLAQRSGIHISDISRVFNHKQTLSLKHLDAITKALGLAEGSLYPYYLEECFNENKRLDKRRSVQFLYTCITRGYEKQCCDLLLTMTAEKSDSIRTNYLAYIFTVAEKLFKAKKEEKALPLYELIIENEINNFSEQLATSYFRRFYIVRMSEKGQHALPYVLEHLVCMPSEVRMEAYLWITAFYYRREQWGEVLYYAERLENMVKEGEYFARALMYKSFALARLGGSLEEVLALTAQYAQVNEYFADIAAGNRFAAFLEFGKLEYADEYFAWLEDREDMYVGLPKVLEAYVHLDRMDDAKKLLNWYQHIIDDLVVSKEPWIKQKMYLDFRYAHALYQCKTHIFPEGLNELLNVAYTANQIGNVERFKKCLLVYWKYSYHATPDQRNKYIQLLSTKEIEGGLLTQLRTVT
ncbi:helix-turn-helix domain-containing protein [Peribacillus muralis]|uniref:helix-turn-helix domain-containing protein n=1 Tax=Peribacillus muralis TaxID=264697 RepID=UPI00070B3D0F|nr:helix-turn-helix transcriptional regulator [Peribacillus muralis]